MDTNNTWLFSWFILFTFDYETCFLMLITPEFVLGTREEFLHLGSKVGSNSRLTDYEAHFFHTDERCISFNIHVYLYKSVTGTNQ